MKIFFLFYIIKNKKINTIVKRIAAMTVILLCYTAYLTYLSQQNYGGSQTLESFNNKLTITQEKDGKLNLQDNGFFSKKRFCSRNHSYHCVRFLANAPMNRHSVASIVSTPR